MQKQLDESGGRFGHVEDGSVEALRDVHENFKAAAQDALEQIEAAARHRAGDSFGLLVLEIQEWQRSLGGGVGEFTIDRVVDELGRALGVLATEFRSSSGDKEERAALVASSVLKGGLETVMGGTGRHRDPTLIADLLFLILALAARCNIDVQDVLRREFDRWRSTRKRNGEPDAQP